MNFRPFFALSLAALGGGFALGAILTSLVVPASPPTSADPAPGSAAVRAGTLVAGAGAKSSAQALRPTDSNSIEQTIALLRSIASDPEEFRKSARLFAVIEKLSAPNLKQVIENFLQNRPDGDSLVFSFDRLFRIAPIQAAEMVRSLPQSINGDESLRSFIFAVWLCHDPNAGVAWLRNLPANQKSELTPIALGLQALFEPSASSFSLINNLGATSEQRIEYRRSVIETWVYSDLSAATAAVLALPEGKEREAALSALFSSGAEIDPRGMLKLAVHLKSPTETVADLAEKIGVDDPKVVLEFRNEISDPDLRSALVRNAFSSWSKNDPQGAWDYTQTELNETERPDAMVELSAKVVVTDPDLALTWLTPTESDNAEQRALKIEVSNGYSVYEKKADGLHYRSTSFNLIDRLSNNQPERTAAWLANWPDNIHTEMKSEAIAKLTSRWASNDPAAAGTWLRTLPVGPNRDAGIASFADALAERKPALALDWITSIADPKVAQSKLLGIYRQAAAADPAAARAWLARANLPDSVKKGL